MSPKNVLISGVEYMVSAPTGRDYMESIEMKDFEKACFFILRNVTINGEPAFDSLETVQDSPLALLLNLESVVSSLLEYEIPDPT